MNAKEQVILKAYEIAARDLRACYNPDGIVAGRTHFNSYWSRDGFWGVFGALELRDFDQARRHIELFIRHQRPSGEMPTRIEFLTHAFGHFHGMRGRLLPVFRAGHLARPVDPTALFIMALWQYYRHSGEKQILKENFHSINHAVSWLQHLDIDRDGLVESGILSDWMDSVIKWGKLLHVNIMYYKALDDFAKICEILNRDELVKPYREASYSTKKAINQQFWNEQFFADWRRGNKTGNFCADGNVLAILLKIASREQAETVFDFIDRHDLELESGLHTVYPRYPWYSILPNYYLYGIPDYHTRLVWPWITSLYGLAKWRQGKKEQAIDTLYNTARLFLAHDFVGEVYEPNGTPVRRLIYQSEVPFAWNAAAFVYAVKSVGLAGRHMVMVK